MPNINMPSDKFDSVARVYKDFSDNVRSVVFTRYSNTGEFVDQNEAMLNLAKSFNTILGLVLSEITYETNYELELALRDLVAIAFMMYMDCL